MKITPKQPTLEELDALIQRWGSRFKQVNNDVAEGYCWTCLKTNFEKRNKDIGYFWVEKDNRLAAVVCYCKEHSKPRNYRLNWASIYKVHVLEEKAVFYIRMNVL